MRVSTSVLRPMLCGCLTLALSASTANAAAPKDPPGTDTIMADFHKWFDDHCNKDDNTIGRVEAAKAYGYSGPIPAGVLGAKKNKTDSESMLDKPSKPSVDPKKWEGRKDYKFFSEADKDGDEKVDKDEFEAWAHEKAVKMAKDLNKAPQKNRPAPRARKR